MTTERLEFLLREARVTSEATTQVRTWVGRASTAGRLAARLLPSNHQVETPRSPWSHWPAPVVLVVGLLVRFGDGTGGPRDVVMLLVAAAVYAVLDRWGAWRWFAAAAAAPAALAPSPPNSVPYGDLTDIETSLLLLVSIVIVAATWRAWWHAVAVTAGVTVTVAGFVLWETIPGAGGLTVNPLTVAGDHPAPSLVTLLLLVSCGVIGLAGAAGVARASGSALRWPSLTLVVVPLVAVLAAWPGGPATWQHAWALIPAVIAWWPAAGALGLTAMLRGRRSHESARPQSDEVDAAALARFRDTYGEPRLAPVVIVIAAYNEAPGLPRVLEHLPVSLAGLPTDVVVVDDGSADGTAELAGERAFLAVCPRNRGQGAALRLGYRIAREHGASYVLTTDADGQYGEDDFAAVLQPIIDDRADWVTGSRVLGRSETHDRVRRTGTYVFAWLASVLTGTRVTDTSFGLRAMRAEVTAAVTLNQPQYQSSELMLGVISHGFRVHEVPATMHERSAGSSKKGGNLLYGSRYGRVMTGTWLREGAPRPVTQLATALRHRPVGEGRRRLVGWWRTDRPFLVALGLGAVVRMLVMIAFPPAFVFSDGPTYLWFSDNLVPNPDRPIGYGVFLAGLHPISHSVFVIAVVQHLLGLATAVAAYVLLRRWGVASRLAMVATLPLLFDQMQLVLEHSILSDVLFDLLLILALVALTWRRRPTIGGAVLAGLLLGAATVVRVVGQPLILVAVAFLLLVAAGLRRKLVLAAAALAAFALPVVAYAGWYHAANGSWALTEASGRSLYMRTTTFVDCSQVELPSYEQALCPEEPVGDRLDPTQYGWHSTAVHELVVPPGMTANEVLQDFGMRAIKAQPGDYVQVVLRDFALPFWSPSRVDHYDYDTAGKWTFSQWVDYHPTSWTLPAYLEYGGQLPSSEQPWAGILTVYGAIMAVPGPVMLALLAVALAGLVVRRGPQAPPRALLLLLMLSGLGLSLAPDVTAEFVWRYQLPLLMLLPLAAALGWTRLRGGMTDVAVPQQDRVEGQPTRATPSTD